MVGSATRAGFTPRRPRRSLRPVRDGSLRELETSAGIPGLAEALIRGLAGAPDPEAARLRAVELLGAAFAADPERMAARWASAPQRVLVVLRGVCGVAPFLVRHLTAMPEALLRLLEDTLDEPRAGEPLRADLDAALESAPRDEAEAVLRRFKYAELARICARDSDPGLVPAERSGETLAELSRLADALLSAAFEVARQRLAEQVGAPRWKVGETVFEPRFAVLGLGKLGGGELNFSSDVDLIYVLESSPPDGAPEDGPSGLAPEAWARRLANAFGAVVTPLTADGFLYRIDLDLRPEGEGSAITIGDQQLAAYYDGWAALWEKAAFMKARPVAGDLDFGWDTVRGLHPMVYRSAIDFGGVAAMKEMKARVEAQHVRGSDGFHVKLGTGGIRDLEFAVQALQLVHGARVPEVRGRSTQAAIASLAAHDAMGTIDPEALLAAYRFLRRLENRLQMEGERQVHVLPADGAARTRAVRAMGYVGEGGTAAFERHLEGHRSVVRGAFDRLFSEDDEGRVLALFSRSAPRLLQLDGTRSMVEGLARSFARELAAAADPGLALNNLDRFIHGLGTRTGYWGLLLDRPELVPRLTGLFGTSKYLSNLLASHPDLIEPVFGDPDVLVLPRGQLERDLAGLEEDLVARGDRDPIEARLAALRLFTHRQLVNVGLLDVAGKIARSEAEEALTDLAEVCVESALAVARDQLAASRHLRPEPEGSGFLVVGMGKLASRELSYGSDLDLIFLYDVGDIDDTERAEAQQTFARLAQKLIGALDVPTAEGFCWAVDARLRPSGNQGALVTSMGSFRSYHAGDAMAWERQALLRARPVAGAPELARAFEEARLEILRRPSPDGLADEIHRVRQRMETELANETAVRRDLKVGRGGLVDVEFAVQYLQLAHGGEHPELLRAVRTEQQLERLEALGLLAPDHAAGLRAGWDFLKRLSSRLRIVQNRSISDLREDRSDLDSVARALGYAPSARSGDARRPLLEDYKRHTDTIRRIYLAVLEAG